MKKYVTPKEAAAYYGVNISTLRRWDQMGKLDSIRTPGNQRRFCIDDQGPKSKPVIAYARVSTYTQRDDLDRQVEFLHSKLTVRSFLTLLPEMGNYKRRMNRSGREWSLMLSQVRINL